MDGQEVFARASALNLEGIISKKADAPYRSGRSQSWIKAKCIQTARFPYRRLHSGDRRDLSFVSRPM
jgi:ATP-dependent DNA ligase